MKSLYDSALSGISKLMDSKIDSYTESKEMAISSLEAEKQAAEDAYQAQIDAIDDKIKALEKEKKANQDIIDDLNDEIDKIREANEERNRQLTLQEKQIQLERMQHQRTILQYSEDKGMHYVTDTEGIRKAKNELSDAEDEIKIADIEKQIKVYEDLNDKIDDTIDNLNEQKDAIQDMIDASNKYYDTLIKEQEKYFDSMIKNMERQKSKWEELAEIEEIAEAYSAIEQVFGELGYSVEDILNGSESAFEDFKSRYIAIMSDMNQNTSFQDGLEYASGVAKENFGSIVSDAHDTVQELSQAFGDGTFSQAITQGISDGIASAKQELDKMDQLGKDAGDGLINGWDEKVDVFIEAVKQAAIAAVDAFAEGQDSHSPSEEYRSKAIDAIDGLLLGIEENKQAFIDAVKSLAEEGVLAFEEGFNFENSTLNTSFDTLKVLIESVTEALGTSTDETVGGLLGALEQLSKFTFNEDGIIQQFNNLKTAIDEVTSAISGGIASSGGEGQGGGSGSAKGSKSGGKGSKNGSNGNSLKSAITDIGTTASTVIGQPEAEDNGTVIGEFGSLETAVGDVTAAIGSGDSKGGKNKGQDSKNKGQDSKGGDNLIDSIIDLGNTTKETLGESGGDGVTGRFEEFRNVIGEANEHVHSISDGLDEIDGRKVECTIKVKIETTGGLPTFATGTALDGMNLNSTEYNAQYKGNAHYEGTAKVTGDWGVRAAGKALVGELGQEIVVSSDGKWRTVGDNGAEFVYLKENDIVFNHLQTKELLSKGNLVGRGKALADGTALASGTAHVNGTVNDDTPHYPSQEILDFTKRMKRLEMQHELIANYTYGVLSPLHDIKQNTENMISNISSISNVTNNNNNNIQQPVINGGINITCPGVTSKEVAQQVGVELNHMFSGLHLEAMQQSMMR